MKQQTLQFMKQTQIAETCKKNAEIYFNIKEKPINPTNRPPESQQINYAFDNPLSSYPGIISRINDLSNSKSSIPKEPNNRIADDLKTLAKNTQNPTKFNELVRDFYNLHPDSAYPLAASLCIQDDTSVSSTLASTPIDIKEIGPYFALGDEMNLNEDNSFDPPLMTMISKEVNNLYVQPPIFISSWKRDPPEQYTDEAALRYNYYVQLVSQLSEQTPKLTQAFNFDEYSFNNKNKKEGSARNNQQKAKKANPENITRSHKKK